jgi:hypothetical protein
MDAFQELSPQIGVASSCVALQMNRTGCIDGGRAC